MNLINKKMTLNIRSCFNLKNLKRTSYSTLRPLLNFSYDANVIPNKFNRRYNSGVFSFFACSRCTASYDVQYQPMRSSALCQQRSYFLSSSSLLVPSTFSTSSRFCYSTDGTSKSADGSGSGKPDRPSGGVGNDSATPACEKIKSYDPLPPDTVDCDVVEKKLSLFQKFKEMYRDYWYVLLPVHCVTSVFWFGGFYFLAESGVDIVSILEYIGISESLIEPFRNGNAHVKAGYIAVTLALYKIATPLRYTVTLGGTTVAINYLKRWGYIKPMPKKERLKELYFEKKDILREKKDQLKSNVLQHLKEVDSNSTSTSKRK